MTSVHFPITLEALGLAFAGTLTLSFLMTWYLTRFMSGSHPLARFLLQHALAHKDKEEMSPFGGLAVVASFLIVMWGCFYLGWVPGAYHTSLLLVTVGMLGMILLGFVDDLVNLKPRFKLVVQMVLALFLVLNGMTATQVGDLAGPGWAAAGSVLWIAGITNGFNLVDGQDGLSGGLGFITCCFAVMIFWDRQIFEACLLAALLGGSVLGFLFFNFPPARIYLGNTGSLPLGLAVSLIFVSAWSWGFQDEVYFAVPIALLAVPLSDTVFAFIRRIFKGISPFQRDADHLHHRLENLGLTPSQSLLVLYGVTLYFGLATLAFIRNIGAGPHMTILFSAFLAGNSILLILTLLHFERIHKGGSRIIRGFGTSRVLLFSSLLALNVVFFLGTW